jgi:hypothetical protein
MDDIRAGSPKPLKKTTINAHKGKAGANTAPIDASPGANMRGLAAFLGAALGKRRKGVGGKEGDDGWDDDDEDDDQDSDPKTKGRFGEPRRRFL